MGPARRTRSNCRVYDDKQKAQLEQICAYRNAGLKLADIRAILRGSSGDGASAVLRRRMLEIDAEIRRLRTHQRAIAALLHVQSDLKRTEMITKEKWVSIMKNCGFTEDDMHRWHAEFEKSAPEEHQEFLQFLHIPDDDIRQIRTWSRDRAATK
jgi:DNA-binding transcriptional MerR regulator